MSSVILAVSVALSQFLILLRRQATSGNDAKHYQIRDVKRAIELVSDEKE
jgi:hypothetical protein